MFYHRVFATKKANQYVNSADPDDTDPQGGSLV